MRKASNVNIGDNINIVRSAIAEAAFASGRAADSILLVAASKTQPFDLIRSAIDAGVDAVGENRVQEMIEKHSQGAYLGAPLHFIGHLQSNKVARIVGLCDLIESVGSVSLLELIGRHAVAKGITQNVLIEVNIGREPQKSGILPEHTSDILDAAAQINGINVLGLMAIPPINDENEKICYYFDKMFQLFVDMSVKKYDNVSMGFLSMGMSDSYADAIRAGANIVRIGSAIFGERT